MIKRIANWYLKALVYGGLQSIKGEDTEMSLRKAIDKLLIQELGSLDIWNQPAVITFDNGNVLQVYQDMVIYVDTCRLPSMTTGMTLGLFGVKEVTLAESDSFPFDGQTWDLGLIESASWGKDLKEVIISLIKEGA